VKPLGRRNAGADDSGSDDSGSAAQTPAPTEATPEATPGSATRTTSPKGRPTPKRNDKAKKRGPVAPAPMTSAEARQRRKEMRKTMTREERKAEKVKRRAAMATQRERMMAGEQAFLMPRDKGEVRAYVRDLVDSRRNLLGLFLPLSLMLIFLMLALPKLAYYSPPFTLALMLGMLVDGFLLARKVNKAVDAKFPDTTETHRKLGLYAVSRATQLRRSRVPRPRVERGATVA